MNDPASSNGTFRIAGGVNQGEGDVVMLVEPEWGEEIGFGLTKFRRPLNQVARNQLGMLGCAVADLHEHFDTRVKELERENAELRERLGKLEG